MKISIIVPTYQHCEDLLKPCLESVKTYTDLSDTEVIVVANGCTDNTKEYVESLGEPFKLVWFTEGLGFTKATNEGLKVAKGDFIIFLNNDTVLLSQEKNKWIDLLIKPLKENVGITAPLISYCPYAERNFAIFFCAATRRDVLEQIGLLNEEYSPGGGEDTEYAIKVQDLGYKLLQVPDEHLHQEGNYMVGTFPIFHWGEATMLDKEHSEEWHKVIERNREKLKRFRLPEGWFYPEDIKEYRRLVSEIPDGGSLCELGCYKGRSLCSVADIIKRKNIKVTVIDIFTGTDNEVKEQDYQNEFEENVKRFGLDVRTIKGYTFDVVKTIDENYDLVFLDADHSYEAVKQDILDWKDKTKVLAGHDYNSHIGVNKAVDELLGNVTIGGTIWSKKS